MGDAIAPLPWTAGTIRRLVLSPDGTAAFGITDSRVLRLDPARMTSAFAAEGLTVLLDGITGADVWLPRETRTPLRAATRPADDRPDAVYAFELGGHVWTMPSDGVSATLAVPRPPGGWVSQPQWSPAGDRFLTVLSAGDQPPRSTLVVAGRGGGTTRIGPLRLLERPAWSPDGSLIAVATYAGARADWWLDDAWEIRLFGASGVPQGAPIPGRQAAWVEDGLAVVDSGRLSPRGAARIDHTVRLPGGRAERILLDAGRVALDTRALALRDPDLPLAVGSIASSGDGRYLGAWLYRVGSTGGSQSRVYAVARVSDGAVVLLLPSDARGLEMGGVEWAPRGALFAYTSHRTVPGRSAPQPCAQAWT